MVTPMNVADSTEFGNVLTDAGMFVDLQKVIIIFDRGYWNLTRFRDLTVNGIRFIYERACTFYRPSFQLSRNSP